MVYLLALEAIGDDAVSMQRSLSRTLDTLGVPPAHRGLVNNRTRSPWVARITDTDPTWGMERTFLRGNKDYTKANSKGSRGIYVYYHLREGEVYEVNNLETWSTTDRYFCRIEGGAEVRMSKEEVEAWLSVG